MSRFQFVAAHGVTASSSPAPSTTFSPTVSGCQADATAIFSPFGLGVLDLAVGGFVYGEVERCGELQVVDGFFHELGRYG